MNEFRIDVEFVSGVGSDGDDNRPGRETSDVDLLTEMKEAARRGLA